MAELEVGSKLQSLGHRGVAVSLEHHHGDRAARERIADDELSEHAERWSEHGTKILAIRRRTSTQSADS